MEPGIPLSAPGKRVTGMVRWLGWARGTAPAAPPGNGCRSHHDRLSSRSRFCLAAMGSASMVTVASPRRWKRLSPYQFFLGENSGATLAWRVCIAFWKVSAAW